MKPIFQKLAISDCVLKDTRIDIWQYPLHTSFAGAESLLSEDELTRAKRYHFARHQRRFTVARAMLRCILARYLNRSPIELVFSYTKHGKPQLVNNPSLQFNLSHSDELALLAIGNGFPLGIDVEFFSARPYEGIGKQLFSTSEMQGLHLSPSLLKPLAFFHIWAQKEAFIKACGHGLAYPTQKFDVPILPPTNQPCIDILHNIKWQLVSFMPQVGCSGALCHHPMIEEIRYHTLTKLSDYEKI
jgi:4'-phosphopantetheinyl transferase